MSNIEEILQSHIKPKEKQTRLVEAVASGSVSATEFMAFFESAKGVDRGTCADAMKHISAQTPEVLAPYIPTLIKYINDELPRVKWGVPEAIGNLSKLDPEQTAKAIPALLKNTTDDKLNTTVIKWCAAYALAEIVKNNPKTRTQLLPIFEELIKSEQNNGVKNVYAKALKAIAREK